MTRDSRSWEGRIEGLTHEGLGVGTVIQQQAGKMLRRPIFVPFTVPGDVIVADVTEQKRKYLFGEISAVMKESPERAVPRCKHFMTCGGCNLQHVSYDEQLRQKEKMVAYMLQRKGVPVPHISMVRSLAPQCYRWRSRIAVRFAGKCIAGFRKHRSKEIVPIEECFIIHGRITDVITLLNAAPTSLEGIELETIAVVGKNGKKAGLMVILDDVPKDKRQDVKMFFEDVYARNRKRVANVFFSEDGKVRSYGQVQEHFTYDVGDITFSFLPENFIQANIPTNERLVDTVVKAIGSPQCVLDLYAGIGNFSLPIAKAGATVVAVEGSAQSVLAGTTNALRNGISNVVFFQHSIEPYLREFAKRYKTGRYSVSHPKADVVIVDPPRTGLTPGILKELLSVGIPRIVYVSCNPATLAEDLRELTKNYTITSLTCIDMFPDTPHVECVAVLENNK